jgi:hypothetical protein
MLDYERLRPVEQMVGEDQDETNQLHASLQEARKYILSQKWCRSIRKEWFGIGVGGVVGVFLFELEGAPGVDNALWVISGDLPPAYLVTDSSPTPVSALETYCALMQDWVDAVRGKGQLADAFPVSAKPTRKNASNLEARIKLLRDEIIPAFQ